MIIKQNKNIAVVLLLLALCAAKIPAMLTADIQPWDEGMYAARVNSIHLNGDFLEQSRHSAGGFESGVHPPLFIWLGYGVTGIFGMDEVVFKLIPFLFGLLCVIFIVRLGEFVHSFEAGFLSAMIFSATYIFSVYAKRFQFDIAVTLSFLLCFYLVMLYLRDGNRKFLYWGSVMFGLCLMTKSLFGLFIPFILLVFYFVQPLEVKKFKFSDLVIFSAIGLLMALPWHLYMVMKYGPEFTDYLFGFHIVKRATEGIGGNVKPSGVLYYFSIIMNNIPFGIIVFYAFLKNAFNFRKLGREKVLLWVWFLSGFVIISLFTTKIDTYLMPFLIPACLLLTLFFYKEREWSARDTFIVLTLFLVNLFWYLTPAVRNEIKAYVLSGSGAAVTGIGFLVITSGIFFASRYLAGKINFKKVYSIIVVVFFISANVFYAFNISLFEDGFKLSHIKELSDISGRNKVVYVGSNYEMNPQFSYYFDGIDLGTEGRYSYELLDLKNGLPEIKSALQEFSKGEYIFIIERDNISAGDYPDAKLFVPPDAKLVRKTHGYEMYLN